mmetsp:Transcript_15235/g.28674  ORF Transcript_15235/g.28674 Transcript_15235/m.28674 type:complete len:244 (-) Transcript_15235:2196-2927(-)
MSDAFDSWVFPVLDDGEKHGCANSSLENEKPLKIEDGTMELSPKLNENRIEVNQNDLWHEPFPHGRLLMETILALICTFIYINLIMNRFFIEIQALRNDVIILKDNVQKGHIDDEVEIQALQNDLIVLRSVATLLLKNVCRQRFVTACTPEETFLDLVPYMLEHVVNSTTMWFGSLREKVNYAMETIYDSSSNTFDYSVQFISSATSFMTSVSLMLTNTLSSLKSLVIDSFHSISQGKTSKII